MNKLITSLLHKTLSLAVKITLNSKGQKRALVSYVLFPPPPLNFKFFFDISHNRYLCCYMMCKILRKRGYSVDVYDYQNTEVDYSKSYEIFIGHNKTFHFIANNLGNTCKKILLTTGSSPGYDNNALSKRELDVQQLKSTTDSFFSPIADISWADDNFKVADYVFMIGNDATRKTWPYIANEKVFFYNNLTNVVFKEKEGRANNFLYLSSVGQLRRGLDILIEVFKGRTEKIYICGPYKEPVFMKHFSDVLSQSPNIILKGFIDQTSTEFFSIIQDCTFGLLPSVSEGQSGSVLTMMSHGLIPIITAENGFSNVDEYGILIEQANIESVNEAVNKAVSLSKEDIESKRISLLSQAEKFSTESFAESFRQLLISVDN